MSGLMITGLPTYWIVTMSLTNLPWKHLETWVGLNHGLHL